MTTAAMTPNEGRCEQHDTRRADSGRIYVVWCKRPQAPNARERIGELGAALCEKHASERDR